MKGKIKHIYDDVVAYFGIKLEEIKLRAISKVSNVLSNIFSLVLVCFFAFFSVLFLGQGFSSWINHLLDSQFIGGFIVSFVFLLVTLWVIYLNRKHKISNWFEDYILEILDKNEKEK